MTPESEAQELKEAKEIVGIVINTVKSFGHLGFAMGKETEDAIAAFLSKHSQALRDENAELRDRVKELKEVIERCPPS